MPANAIMIQGTGSSVGKSLLAAALCRIFKQDGARVLPFKAQNMSNNAFVTKEGGEMARAQAEQAKACGVEPLVLMNPILLKPTTDVGAQVIVLGKSIGTMAARDYEQHKPQLRRIVSQALETLMGQAELLVIEGAGSPAEINLKDRDLANMWVAKQARAKVLLVGDIDRGGVFAQLVGTMELLDEEERGLVRGFLINKFRGDPTLLEPGLRWLEARCRRPVVGTIPFLQDITLPEEDAVPQQRHDPQPLLDGQVVIEVIHLPRISNVSDFDPLAREPDVRLRYLDRPGASLPDCVILPGSKSTIADLAWVRQRGLDRYLLRCAEAGREVIGICGGFQMLCRRIVDPGHVEATVGAAEGLGFLPATVVFERDKVVAQVRGVHRESGLPVAGYEIHLGRIRHRPESSAVFEFTAREGTTIARDDGLQTGNGRVWGSHLHGLFDAIGFRRWWLNRLRQRRGLPERAAGFAHIQDVYDQLAWAVRPHLNLDAIVQIIRS